VWVLPQASPPARDRLIAPAFFLVWSLMVAGALAVTLNSLRSSDFDGLNNMLQIPFALPWFLLPLTGWSHEMDAWAVAWMGWLNGAILALWVRRRLAPRP
jgi:hypothetical protein